MLIPELFPPFYFLADCHLPLLSGRGREERQDLVLRFLREEAVKGGVLFIVGDLFDFWFEWRHSVPSGAFPVLAALHDLTRAGKTVIYMGGNHDGHVGSFLQREVGLIVTRGHLDFELDGKRFHIIHGDGVAPADRGYRTLRRLVRWGPTESLYRLVHPDLGIIIARKLSRFSHDTGGNRHAASLEPYRAYALRKLDEGFNYVVMGHIHQAVQIPHPNGSYIGIGDWMGKGSYGVYENGELFLRYFK